MRGDTDAYTPTEILVSRAVGKKNGRRDVQNIIGAVLCTPLRKGPVESVDGIRPLKDYKDANVDIKTRIILQFAADALAGDQRKAEFLFKYGGLEPVKEQLMQVEAPMFVNDLAPASAATNGCVPIEAPDDDDDDDDDDCDEVIIRSHTLRRPHRTRRETHRIAPQAHRRRV